MAKDKKENKEAKEGKKNTAVGLSISILLGDILSSKFFGKNKFSIILIVGLLMVYITFKYEFQTHMEAISKLQTELSVAKSESIRERSTYMSRIRESHMHAMIDSLHLGLRAQEQPPYRLTYDK